MDKKDVIVKLNKLHNVLHDRLCWVSDGLEVLKEIVSDSGLENKLDLTQYLTYKELEQRIKDELYNWWLERLSYFLNNIDLHNLEIVKLDNYWNCDYRIRYSELMWLINELIDEVEWMQDDDFE